MKKLLNTFGETSNKNALAIDSSDSESDEEDHKNKTLNEDEVALYSSDDSLENSDNDDSFSEEDGSRSNEDEVSNKQSLETSEIAAGDNKEQLESEEDIDETQDDDIDNLESHDPFVKHFLYDLQDSMLESLQNKPSSLNNHIEHWSELGKLVFQIPECDTSNQNINSNFSISETKIYAPQGEVPKRLDSKSIISKNSFLKNQIVNNLIKNSEKSKHVLSSLQEEIFSIINNYQDLYYPGRTFSNSEEIRYVYCLHAANHILKTRLKVLHHNARLSKKDDVPEEFRDQGLVRPKVLIILPFKEAAYRTIQMLIKILLPEDKGNVMNKKRFIEDYTGNELELPKKNPKPEDYEQTFQGNTSDDFKIGITVTKKSLKLYADFYSSDIIIASPLGLRTIIGAEGEQERDFDFLASIELLIFDQTEIFIMQNWDHIFHILNHMHLQPKDSHGTDFSRVRTWSLNGWAKYYRQTLIFSSLVLPEINAVFNRKCSNYAGKVRVANTIEFGCIGQVFVQLPHVFHRFDAQSAADVIDTRFDCFVNRILPQQKESLMKQTLVFIPNYFDYVRIRNYFKKEDLGFVQICEYSKEAKVARARDMFFHGDAHFLLYTERYHFFNRKRIKGIRHLVFYQLPNFPHFYYEMCNLMQAANMNKKIGNMANMTVTVIYSKYDVHQLSSIVGTDRAAKMMGSDRKVHMMLTGVD
ncbi:hypothetical protein NQ318_014415 [Aromia moschata]|uniref:Digestive organ expansion factor homolog n=1 Tax=Aromia moschata TaxID=1265417 RepID=A0AAV8Y4W6_9CUCU|nr:hypothetical protein NQ318_014415 [Aromia moschata]